MFRYTTIYINIVSFIISVIIFTIVNFLSSNYCFFTQKGVLKAGFKVINEIESQTEKNQKSTNEINNKDIIPKVENTQDWFLEIPSINLKAFIQEGTSKDVLEKYVGHFVETSKDTGNIGLAAHNRGYENNYFENLKKLKQGDIIYYQYNGIKKQYQVTKTSIIKDDDWTNLEQTQNNTITLITCVENQPEYRRCIQGKEK